MGPNKIGIRNLRELQTLALALDYITDFKLKSMSDVLAQRFLALEQAIQTNTWQYARWIELIAPENVGLLATHDMVEARKYEKLLFPKKSTEDSSSEDDLPKNKSRRRPAARPQAADKDNTQG